MASYVGEPPFRAMVRASGLAEVWTHDHDDAKFGQFGWRCTTKENSYGNDTLVGNWTEERFDISKQTAQRLPSQYEHYFQSTYGTNYNKTQRTVPQELSHLSARASHAHPGHQPDLDNPSLKRIYNSWETTSRAAYVDPKIRKTPLEGQKPQ